MVSRATLHRALHQLGYTLPVLGTVVVAVGVYLLYEITIKLKMILFLLNGGCL